jgi:hypothetical protein
VAAGGAGGNYSNPGDPQGGGLTSFGNYPASPPYPKPPPVPAAD